MRAIMGAHNGIFCPLKAEEKTLGIAVATNREGGFGPVFDHMTLAVTLAERWLVDVGFGDSFLEPLLLDSREEQVQGSRTFRIDAADENNLILLRRNEGEDWEPQYRFTLQSFGFPDYEEMCRFHQTSPESHFTQNLICSRVTEDGRITLSDMRLVTTSGPERTREEQMLTSREEYDRVLRDEFGIVMKNQVKLP